ncbi:hypothetical protein PSPO01_10923 [Paraphaeosphaeria sporulosa]
MSQARSLVCLGSEELVLDCLGLGISELAQNLELDRLELLYKTDLQQILHKLLIILFLLLQILSALSVALDTTNLQYLFEDVPGYVPEYRNLAQSVVINSPPVAKDQRNGNFVLVNQCKYDLKAWKAYQSDPIKVPARSIFRKGIIRPYELTNNHTCTDNCGVTYKVSETQ